MLIEGSCLEPHRKAMASVGRTCFFDDGVKVFAHPDDVHDILYHFAMVQKMIRFSDGSVVEVRSLKPRHVIVSTDWECDVLEALVSLPKQVNVKRRALLHFEPVLHVRAFSPASASTLLSSTNHTPDDVPDDVDGSAEKEFDPWLHDDAVNLALHDHQAEQIVWLSV
jgi:hypothetical protein